VTALLSALAAAPGFAHAQESAGSTSTRWDLGLTALYEYDTNPLRHAAGSGDRHFRLLPAFSLRIPAGDRSTLWLRSSFRADRYGTTSVLNGLGLNAALGFTRRLGRRGRVYGSYSFLHSEQPDVLAGSPLRFASYAQHGASLGTGWDLTRTDTVQAEGFAARRSYRGLVNPGITSQVDPLAGFDLAWTHRIGASALRMDGQTLWHRSNNPRYRYSMPLVALGWDRPVGRQGRLGLGATRAWLHFSDRKVGSRGVLRRDDITELRAFLEWGRRSPLTPFIQLSRQWDNSTDPLRRFTDGRILVGARLAISGSSTAAQADNGGTPAGKARPLAGDRGRRDEAWRRVGLAYDHLTRREWDQAARESRQATTLDPVNAHAWANLGIALFKMGDVAGARWALERSLALDPKNDRLRALLARPELRR
jgi:hypothetical protein